ncbi:hexose carrier protein HEX6-like [Diospyros lotus]|uniref:hexose carrier protein HEX6-like n=1 Tax=Diospyros lotus TaxID=55363 RepID=UPI002253724E|nr:hexose carrier protein HEX6-like [Diospyros lotus]XP_052174298.1 hexose carrier protein HEX6-like [Diospyros lotus]XP_052174309.1 hexose carrier protein HEX6-like [Diospyros lotus]XP_052174318.1 hexose carrier protein HEX6-like [Diospyros lotus]XP_052174320.1 hexose carrier protein HEX6-like [Diospyros lotus]
MHDSTLHASLVKVMAEESGMTRETGKYKGRLTSFVILSCMVAATGGAIFGYEIGISGGVSSMNAFLEKFFPNVHSKMREDSNVSNYCKFNSQLLTLFTSLLYASSFIASLFASSVTRTYGRRPSIIVGGAAYFAGAVLSGAASNLYMLMSGRVLLGVGIGFADQAVPLYLSEMAPARYRGAITMGFHINVHMGALSANLINYGTEKIKTDWGWRISLSLAAVPATILTVGALFLHETPNSLIQRTDHHQNAKLILQKIRGTKDVEVEFDDLINASAISKTVTHPFKNITRKKYRPQLIMAVAIPLFQQLTGINVIAFYGPILFRTAGLGESASLLSTVLIRVVNTVATFISMSMVDKVGRRVLFLIGGIQMLISQIVVGSIMATQLGDYGGVSKGYAFLLLVFVCIYDSGYGLSWGPLTRLVASEIFPLEIRSAGQSITVAVNFLGTIVIAQTFLAVLCHLKSGIFFFFGGWLLLMTVFIYLFFPETKKVPIEQVDRIWKEHWFWKRIVGKELDLN